MLISIGMMVKNEEKYLDACLTALVPILNKLDSELVIVDTGSTDKTVEIAKKYTDKVYFHKWNNNFSDMRNITLGYCSGEWFFYIDGDEVLDNSKEIINFFTSKMYKKYKSATINIKNLIDLNNENTYSIFPALRLFDKDKEFKFVNAVHNQPLYKEPIKNLNVDCKHYGYISTDKELMGRKFKRTSTILKNELEKYPNNVYYRHQLSVSYAMYQDHENALNEAKRAFASFKKQKLAPKKYLYLYYQLGVSYINNKRYADAEKVFEEGIQVEKEYVDLYFYLGLAKIMLGKNEEGISIYENYLNLLRNYNKLSIKDNTSIIAYTLGFKDRAYYNLALTYHEMKMDTEALQALNEITSDKYIEISTNLYIEVCFKLSNYKALKQFYQKNMIGTKNQSLFLVSTEKKVNMLNAEDKKTFINAFSNGDDEYFRFNNIRRSYINNDPNLYDKINNFINSIHINTSPDFYGDLIFYLIGIKKPLSKFYSNVTESNLNKFFNYIVANYDNFPSLTTEIINIMPSDSFEEKRINKTLCKWILYSDKLDENSYNKIFQRYINDGIGYLTSLYKDSILENEAIVDLKNSDEAFLLYLYLASKSKKSNGEEYVQYLKKALHVCPYMHKGIEILLNEFKETSNKVNQEFEEYKLTVKENINRLINGGYFEEAERIINDYEKIVQDDVEIYSIKSIILINKGNFVEAEQVLLQGLNIDSNNFDLLYNLAYLYEQQEKFADAFKYYKKALAYCNDESLEIEIKNTILKLENKHGADIKVKTKIVFFDKGDDKFIWDIINELSKEYETKHIRVKDFKQIDEGMEWADICWFEWCDELVGYGSKLPIANKKKIICRLHSYEAFTNYPENVNWSNVNTVVFVAGHIRDFVVKNYKLDINKTIIIPNGVDIQKYSFKEREPGFNIAYVGYINYKKGPMLLLQTFKAVYDKDSRYKLYIAGQFQDYRDLLYFKQMIKEFGIEKNVMFEGWQGNLNNWLEDKNYILCTSILESQNMSVMQAMAKGIKPVIHNFVGAKAIYDIKYIWNSIDEALKMITEKEYNSSKARKFIEDSYSFEKQLNSITNLIKSKNVFKFTHNGTEIKFFLPYLNDWIQRVIYETNNFYEVGMLQDIKNRLGANKTVIDVGTNIGNHTVYFSKICKAKKVYSFEPQVNIFKILKENIKINGIENVVELHNIGVGKEHNFAEVKILDKNNYGMTRLYKTQQGTTEINSLDNIFINQSEKIDMIKVDVEGMELEVLEGAKTIIQKFKPLIYIEAGTAEEFKSVSEFFNEVEYKPICKFNATPTYLFVHQVD